MADDEKDYSYYRLKLFDAYVVQTIEQGRKDAYLKQINDAIERIAEIQEEKKILLARIEEIQHDDEGNKDENTPDKQDPGVVQLTSEKPQKLDIHFSKRRLHVFGFEKGTKEKELWDFFAQFGEVEDISLFPQYAFITFECYYKFPPYRNNFKGGVLTVQTMAPWNDPKLKTKTILVNGVLTDIPEDSLAKYFSKYGKVNKVKMQKSSPVKRFAYVIFEKEASVVKAIETTCHMVDGKLVDIRKAREEY